MPSFSVTSFDYFLWKTTCYSKKGKYRRSVCRLFDWSVFLLAGCLTTLLGSQPGSNFCIEAGISHHTHSHAQRRALTPLMCPLAPVVPSSRYHPSHPSIRGFIPLPLTARLPYFDSDIYFLSPALYSCQRIPNPSSHFSRSAYLLPLALHPCHLDHASSRTYKSKQISSMMETPTPCGPSSADTNQYLAITIHILVAVGFSYLLRLLYQLIRWLLFSRLRSPDERDGESPSPLLIRFLDSSSKCKDLKLTVLVSFTSISRRKHRH